MQLLAEDLTRALVGLLLAAKTECIAQPEIYRPRLEPNRRACIRASVAG